MSREAMQMALEALMQKGEHHPKVYQAAEALRQALAQPEQEPVAWVCYGMSSDEKHCVDYEQSDIDAIPVGAMLYTAPPKQWVGLTDDEIEDIYFDKFSMSELEGFARSIEQALKEKNK